jgi:ketosteroid isomerase-like protein
MRVLKIVILLFICISPYTLKAQNQNSGDKKEVYRTIILISTAWTQNNLDTLEKYIHKDYIHTDVRGEILDRTAWLSYVKDRKDKRLTNADIEFDDVQINVYNDFAFVTGINAFSGQAYVTNDNGNNKPRKLRFTQVLKKENNIWKRILFQATYIEAH